MSFVHPIVMAGFYYLLFLQRNLGKQIIELKERSPEYENRSQLVQKHKSYAFILLGVIFAGMIGGILVTSYLLQSPMPLFYTYGHGFFGILSLAIIIAIVVLGFNIKNVIRPKIKNRFLQFHINMVYLVAIFGVFSLLTGVLTLTWGLSQ